MALTVFADEPPASPPQDHSAPAVESENGASGGVDMRLFTMKGALSAVLNGKSPAVRGQVLNTLASAQVQDATVTPKALLENISGLSLQEKQTLSQAFQKSFDGKPATVAELAKAASELLAVPAPSLGPSAPSVAPQAATASANPQTPPPGATLDPSQFSQLLEAVKSSVKEREKAPEKSAVDRVNDAIFRAQLLNLGKNKDKKGEESELSGRNSRGFAGDLSPPPPPPPVSRSERREPPRALEKLVDGLSKKVNGNNSSNFPFPYEPRERDSGSNEKKDEKKENAFSMSDFKKDLAAAEDKEKAKLEKNKDKEEAPNPFATPPADDLPMPAGMGGNPNPLAKYGKASDPGLIAPPVGSAVNASLGSAASEPKSGGGFGGNVVGSPPAQQSGDSAAGFPYNNLAEPPPYYPPPKYTYERNEGETRSGTSVGFESEAGAEGTAPQFTLENYKRMALENAKVSQTSKLKSGRPGIFGELAPCDEGSQLMICERAKAEWQKRFLNGI